MSRDSAPAGDVVARALRTVDTLLGLSAQQAPNLVRPDLLEVTVDLGPESGRRLLQVHLAEDRIADLRIRRTNDRMDLLPESRPGPLGAVFDALRDVPGWLTWEDCSILTALLGLQTALGVRGDLVEIGCYYGRSAGLLATRLEPAERLVLCDTFELGEPGAPAPDEETVRANVRRAAPDLTDDRVVVHRCRSADLFVRIDRPVRAVHIDGGHDEETVSTDLAGSERLLQPGGILVVDDYDHPRVRGVTTAVETFLAERPQARVVADVHRGAVGRKLVLLPAGGPR